MRRLSRRLFLLAITFLLASLWGCKSAKNEEPVILDQLCPAEQARAGRITKASELLSGPRAQGQLGDFKLYNSRVGFVIRSAENRQGFFNQGGGLIDALRTGGQDELEEIYPLAGLVRVLRPLSITAINTPGFTGQAIIRVRGIDEGLHMIDATGIVLDDQDLEVQVDYILEPEAAYLRIVTTLVNRGYYKTVYIGDSLQWGDDLEAFTPGLGFVGQGIQPSHQAPFVSALGEQVSYAWVPSKGARLYMPIPMEFATDVVPTYFKDEKIDVNGQSSGERLFVVGDGDVHSLWKIIREARNEQPSTGVVKGRVTDGLGAAGFARSERLKVVVLDGAGKMQDLIVPDAQGYYSATLAEGTHSLQVMALNRSSATPEPITITTGSTLTKNLTIGALGKVRIIINAKDLQGNSLGGIPAKLTFQKGHDAASGARIHAAEYSTTGGGSAQLVPGDYTVTVSHGVEYGIAKQNIVVTAGAETIVEQSLTREVDTPGYISGDYHTHCTNSMDSTLPERKKINVYVAEGIELLVATDHDYITDHQPLITQMGLADRISSAPGCEVSPYIGHFNFFLPKIDELPGYFPVPWVTYDEQGNVDKVLNATEIFAGIRARYPAALVQINHPRRSGAFFETIGYDPSVGISSVAASQFDWSADTIEVFNGKSGWSTLVGKNLPDWYSLLNQGINFVATGNSDSHVANHPSGFPRNYTASSTDSPGQLDQAEVLANLKAGRSFVCAGPYIEFTVNGSARLGDTVTDQDGAVDLNIRVQSASWIPVSYVKVIGNGVVAWESTLGETTSPVKYDGTVTLNPVKDTWYVVLAGDDQKNMRPAVPASHHPISFTNPIRVDVDGNGFTPPGL